MLDATKHCSMPSTHSTLSV